ETGVTLNIPCPDPNAAASETSLRVEKDPVISLLARTGFPPFSDADWPEQGMVTELVSAAFDASPAPVSYAISWADDPAAALTPLRTNDGFDMGFPWTSPQCDQANAIGLCRDFHFSDPLIDIVILLFVRADDPVKFETDADLHGRVLCRPAGYLTHDLDRADRRWLADGLIKLEQPGSVATCFEMLMDGRVDGVTVNEFLGVQQMFELGLTADVVPMPRQMSVEGLHVAISKSHWRGTAHLYRFNAGLAKLRQSERYSQIVSKHLGRFWDQVRTQAEK
ncbi:MAG: ABC transporter substrate-binding protein, partial [Sulfitobacter sp.]